MLMRLNHSNQHGNSNPNQQRNGKLRAIVRMKLQFRQQITARDAQKRPRAKCQHAAEELGVVIGNAIEPQVKQCNPKRRGERK